MKIVRVERVAAESLRSPARADLRQQLVDVVLSSFITPDSKRAAESTIFRGPGAKLTIYYGQSGEVLGFSSSVIEHHQFRGRTLGVMDSGTYMKPGLRGGGARAVWHALIDGFGFKLQHPRASMCFVGQAATPAMYRLVHRFGHGLYPRPDVPEPEELAALVRHVMSERGYHFVDDDPWRVHIGFPVALRDEPRMRKFIERSRDPAVAFYVERNPGVFEGQWLTIYVPVTLVSLLRMCGRVIMSLLGARNRR